VEGIGLPLLHPCKFPAYGFIPSFFFYKFSWSGIAHDHDNPIFYYLFQRQTPFHQTLLSLFLFHPVLFLWPDTIILFSLLVFFLSEEDPCSTLDDIIPV